MKSGFAQVEQATSRANSGCFSLFRAGSKRFCKPGAAARQVATRDGQVARSTRDSVGVHLVSSHSITGFRISDFGFRISR